MCAHNPKPQDNQRPAAERLADLIRNRQVILFEGDLTDKEYPYIRLSLWGAIPTNELFVKLSNGSVEFVASGPSPIDYPVMADRRLGIDMRDHRAAIELAENLWLLKKDKLIRRSE